MSNRVATVLIFSVALLGLSFGVLAAAVALSRPVAHLEPQVIELVEAPMEHQRVSADFMLMNPTSRPLLVKQVRGSCGCLEFDTAGGPFIEPRLVEPGGRLPWRVTVNTTDRVGSEDYAIQLLCEQAGQTRTLTTSLRLAIQPAWRINPAVLEWNDVEPAAEQNGLIGVYDGRGAKSQRVDRVDTIPTGAVEVRIREPEAGDQLPATLRIHGIDLPLCQVVSVTTRAKPAGESVRAQLQLSASASTQPPVTLSVLCHSRPADYQFEPPTLVLPVSDSERTVLRTVRCRVPCGDAGDLRVVECPDYVTVNIRRLDSTNLELSVACSLGKLSRDSVRKIGLQFAAPGETASVCTLPITLLVRP